MNFAKAKLLDGPITLDDVEGPGALACLSVRFALEFDLTDRYGHKVAHTQVERHMRLCITATAGLEKLVTLAGSEPLLAEAALKLMSDVGAVWHLAENSSLNCIDRGQRGELVAALLIMRARDAAAVLSRSKVVSVNDFMKSLLPTHVYEELESAKPHLWQSDEDKPFSEAFEGYSMWFNHVIKVRQSSKINTKNLWKFITRGAMVMCKDNQRGIDIVLPVCAREKNLSQKTVTAILIQVKNDRSFKHTIEKTLFDGMDPFLVGLFSEDDGSKPLPVIRMVFALASDKCGVTFPAVPNSRDHDDKFTAYDVWCAGLSPETFRDIDGDLVWYQSLLLQSLQPHDAFHLKEVKDKHPHPQTNEARGGLRRRLAPLLDETHDHLYRERVGEGVNEGMETINTSAKGKGKRKASDAFAQGSTCIDRTGLGIVRG
jgi:hypothetical protein